MSEPGGIAPAVRAFVLADLPSLEHLEILALMMRASDRWWDSDGLARELGITPDLCAHILEQLASRNLLEIRVTAEVRYRFQPGNEAAETLTTAFASAYATQRLALVRLIIGEQRQSIRDFADAFRIRRHDHR